MRTAVPDSLSLWEHRFLSTILLQSFHILAIATRSESCSVSKMPSWFQQFVCSLAISLLAFQPFAVSEPVQYCRNGAISNQVDFCMGTLMHHNISTASHDLYLTMSVTRPSASSLGWTAIGLGESMEGLVLRLLEDPLQFLIRLTNDLNSSLMFVVYGDPLSSEKPIVSIRKSIGHKQPTLVTRHDMNGADLRVMRADWHEHPTLPGAVVAMVSLVCYSCHLWPGTEISATATSQPWIWAWNSKQDIPVFTYDAHLKMHVHHAGAGGWGNFYADNARSVNEWHNPPGFPPLRPGIQTLGTSNSPAFSAAYGVAWLEQNPTLHLHGIIMGVVFLFLFPAGVIVMRSGKPWAFRYHWILQLLASSLLVTGFILGLMLGRKIDTFHQVLGITLVISIGAQGVLGWRHHVNFLRIHQRTWLSYAHIWLGRSMMVGGWSNLVTGLVLRGYSTPVVAFLGSLAISEALGLSAFLWWIKAKAGGARLTKATSPGQKDSEAQYFALGEEDDDDEDDGGSASDNLQDEESKPMIEKGERA